MSKKTLQELIDLPLTRLRHSLASKMNNTEAVMAGNVIRREEINGLLEVLSRADVNDQWQDDIRAQCERILNSLQHGMSVAEGVFALVYSLQEMIEDEEGLGGESRSFIKEIAAHWKARIFTYTELKSMVDEVRNLSQDPTLEREIRSMKNAISRGEVGQTVYLDTPEKQLLWGAHLLYLLFNPRLMRTWPNKRAVNRLEKSQVWKDIKQSHQLRYLTMLLGSHIFNLMRNRDLMMRWGQAGSWFYFKQEPRPGLINCDLMYSLACGFDHARACVIHELSHAVQTIGLPPRIVELKAQLEEMDTALAQGLLTGEGQVEREVLSKEYQMRIHFFNACEDNTVNRFTHKIGKVFGQDYGYSLHVFYASLGDVGRRFAGEDEVYYQPTHENKFKNLAYMISRVFLAHSGLFKGDKEGWRSIKARPEWIEGFDRYDREELLMGEEALEQLMGLCEEVEHFYPPIQELSGGPKHYKEQAEMYALKRYELMDEIWDLYAAPIADKIFKRIREKESEQNVAEDFQEQLEEQTKKDPPPPPPEDKEKEDKEEKSSDDPGGGGGGEEDDPQEAGDSGDPPDNPEEDNSEAQEGESDDAGDNPNDSEGESEQQNSGGQDAQETPPQDKEEKKDEGEDKTEGEEDSPVDEDGGEEAEQGEENQAEEQGDSEDAKEGEGEDSEESEEGSEGEEGDSSEEKEEVEESKGEEDNQDSEETVKEIAPEDQEPDEEVDVQEAANQDEVLETTDEVGDDEKVDMTEEESEENLGEDGEEEVGIEMEQDDTPEEDRDEAWEQKQEELQELIAELSKAMNELPEEDPLQEKKKPEDAEGTEAGGEGGDSTSVLDHDSPDDELVSIGDLTEALREMEDEARGEDTSRHEKDREQREERSPEFSVPTAMSLDEMASGSWEDFSKRVAMHAPVISLMAEGLKKLKDVQLKFLHKMSKRHSLTPQGGQMRRYDTKAADRLFNKLASNEDFHKDDLNLFRKDMRVVAPTRPARVILIDGSRSMSMGGSPLPIDKAIQEAVIDYKASELAGYDTYIIMFGPRAPIMLARPGDWESEIGKRIERVRGGLNTATEFVPGLINAIELIATQKKFSEPYVGFTNFVIYSDGDIDDPRGTTHLIEKIFEYAPKSTFDFVLVTHKPYTPVDNMVARLIYNQPIHEIGVTRGAAGRKYPLALMATYKLTNRLRGASKGVADPASLRSSQFRRLLHYLTSR